MHACGHDSHISSGLAIARWAMEHKNQLNGKLKIVFQPAEEGTKGAAGIAYSKNLDDVDYLVGGHIGVDAKLHEVAVIRNGFLATTKMNVTFTGVPAHAGLPPNWDAMLDGRLLSRYANHGYRPSRKR